MERLLAIIERSALEINMTSLKALEQGDNNLVLSDFVGRTTALRRAIEVQIKKEVP